MTLKEAIDIIGHYDVNFYYISGEHEGEEIPANKRMDAFDMAIRSLEAWEKVKNEICEGWDYLGYMSGEFACGKQAGFSAVISLIDKYLSEVEGENETD